jgi:hypothetical protein
VAGPVPSPERAPLPSEDGGKAVLGEVKEMEIYEGDFVRLDPDSDWLEVERVSNLGWGEGVTEEDSHDYGTVSRLRRTRLRRS